MPRVALNIVAWWVIASLLCGCGSAQVASSSDHDMAQMKVVGMLYGRYLEQNGGTGPADQAKFVEFLERDPALWNKIASTPQEMLTSPRDGKPLVLVLGTAVKDRADGGFPWIAHEAEGVGGQQAVINTRGGVQLKGPEELAKIFPPS